MPGKIKLNGLADEGGLKKIAFASYLKKDYAERSLILYLGPSGIPEKLYFHSNEYGTVEWQNGSGLADCHSWEDEDEAKSASELSRRYTAILSDGEETFDYARRHIIPEVLDNLENIKLAKLLKRIVKNKKYAGKIDPAKYNLLMLYH